MMADWFWYHWLFAVMLALGIVVRLAKATGWRPPPDNSSNAGWALASVAYPALWVYVFYAAGFWG